MQKLIRDLCNLHKDNAINSSNISSRNSSNSSDSSIASRRVLMTLLSAVFVFLMLLPAGCKPAPTNDPNTGLGNQGSAQVNLGDAPNGAYTAHDGTWAIYWYICGSDIELREELIYSATGQIQELMEVSLPDYATVVIQAGGAKAWHLDSIDPTKTNYLVYQGDTLSVVDQPPLSNMGDPETFADFLAFCNTNYPAEHQVLILYDRGGGSLMGICNDDLFGSDALTLRELSQVIRSRPAASGTYELIGQCACLMSTIDSVSVFNGYTNYLVGSEEVELGCTWDYTKIAQAIADDQDITGAELGKVIADGYYAQCEQIGYTCYTTTSVIDMAYADELLDAYCAVGDELLQGAAQGGTEFISAYGRAAYASENYGALDGPTSKYEMVDLGDLVVHASELLPNSADGVLRAIDKAMAYHRVNPLRVEGHGVSCYFPYIGGEISFGLFSSLDTSPGFYYFYEYAYTGSLSAQGQAYLASLAAAAQQPEPKPEPLPKPDELGLDGIKLIVERGGYILDIGDRAEYVAEVFEMVGIYDQETDDFVLVGMQSLSPFQKNWENGRFSDNAFGDWFFLDNAICYTDVVSSGEGFVLYRVPVYRNGDPMLMMVIYTWDEPYYFDGEYEILGLITPNSPELNVAYPTYEPLMVGDVIEPALFRYTAASNYQIISEDPGDPMSKTMIVTENTRFHESTMIDGLYAKTLLMIDYSGAAHYSEYCFYYIEDGIGWVYDYPVSR